MCRFLELISAQDRSLLFLAQMLWYDTATLNVNLGKIFLPKKDQTLAGGGGEEGGKRGGRGGRIHRLEPRQTLRALIQTKI